MPEKFLKKLHQKSNYARFMPELCWKLCQKSNYASYVLDQVVIMPELS